MIYKDNLNNIQFRREILRGCSLKNGQRLIMREKENEKINSYY